LSSGIGQAFGKANTEASPLAGWRAGDAGDYSTFSKQGGK